MTRYITALLLLLLSVTALSAQETIQKADTAYTNADYSTALELYKEAMQTEGTSAALYYNIGNAYYRTGSLPQAVLAYERALRLDPSMSEARANLDFVNSKIIDKPGERFSFVDLTLRNIALTLPSNSWAWLGLGLFALFIGCAFVYYFTENVALRKAGFFGGIVLFFLSIAAIAEAFYGKSLSQATDEAIITSKSTILSTSPRVPLNSSEEAMLLHEGTKVYIQDSVSIDSDSAKTVWYDVKVDNEHRAWISENDIEKI